MCRLLVVRAENTIPIRHHLEKFAHVAKNSKEYQGHGWGCAYRDENDRWNLYRNISPIWEDNLARFPSTRLLVAHARSAFQDKDIFVENNMPFFDGRYVYIFNGELRGVKIREQGRIGAEKIFNFIKRFDSDDPLQAIQKAVTIIKNRTSHIRGMNIIMVRDNDIYVSTFFTEDEEYFTMRYRHGKDLIICSEQFPEENDWQRIENNTMRVW
ncbi:MAG TPA: hypothetical protein PK874_02875 [Desulfobacteraceae bacterium]|jgi:glutamine amidotransferase|nr:hypothetical protein [Desulfobacteraceae bacterium]HPJ68300.1 hypothetical protein [Desulfobacteraceae bacterium]HPQ29667.1 hypothetical protein [Desulfobacteraceae bacterium]